MMLMEMVFDDCFAIQAFFQRWWRDQSEKTQTTVKRLVESGQLELMYMKLS